MNTVLARTAATRIVAPAIYTDTVVIEWTPQTDADYLADPANRIFQGVYLDDDLALAFRGGRISGRFALRTQEDRDGGGTEAA